MKRVAAVVDAMARPGFTLGIGPSHEPLIRNVFGLPYDHPGRSTEEYLQILSPLLRGEDADFDGHDWDCTYKRTRSSTRATGSTAHRRARPSVVACCRAACRWSRVVDGAAPRNRPACGAEVTCRCSRRR